MKRFRVSLTSLVMAAGTLTSYATDAQRPTVSLQLGVDATNKSDKVTVGGASTKTDSGNFGVSRARLIFSGNATAKTSYYAQVILNSVPVGKDWDGQFTNF